MTTSRLTSSNRDKSIAALQEREFDVLVIGGGITGVGAALDAASRGLSVALIETRDYAAGTSSKSSKLIHGGLRYLEMLDFKLVREALRERELLLTSLAPHLVKPVPFAWLLTHRFWERLYLGAGLFLYDTIGGARSVPRSRHLSKRRMLEVAPALSKNSLIGAAQFYDAQEDDARMVVYVARTAAEQGAVLATNVRAVGFVRNGSRVVGAEAIDLLTKQPLVIRARHVVSAVGVWGNDVKSMLGGEKSTKSVRPSKGIHIVVPKSRIPMDTGVLMRTEKSVLFIIPWGEHWIIGDTDTDWTYDKGHPSATKTDIEYLLAKVNSVLASPLGEEDIYGVFTGLRPLVAEEGQTDTTKVSREHSVSAPAPGISTIAGGKYTTYRVMAADLIDSAVEALGKPNLRSSTKNLPILGAKHYNSLWKDRAILAQARRLSVETVEHLLNRFGDQIQDIFDLIHQHADLGEPLIGAPRYLRAEVVYAVTHEGALHLDDVLTRRTRISFETQHRGVESAEAVADLIAGHLGWTDEQKAREVAQYKERVGAERRAQDVLGDAEANDIRLQVPDLLPFYEPSVPIAAD